MRRAWVACVLVSGALATNARADQASTCASAYEHGQELRLEHHLRAARDQFLICAQPSCPKVAREDCARWLGEVDASLPAIRVYATRAGAAFEDARVTADGATVAERVDGQPIVLDPGAHAIRVEPRGCEPREKGVVLTADQQPARVDFDVCAEVAPRPIETPPAPAGRSGPPLATFVFGGVAVAGLGTFIGFGSVGVADSNALRASCYPHCAQGSVDSANAELLVADVALGVTLVALAVAGVFWLTNHPHARAAAAPLTWSF